MEKIKINIEINYTCNLTEEANGKFSCHMPGPDIYFGAKDKEEAEKKAKIMAKSLIDLLVRVNKKGR